MTLKDLLHKRAKLNEDMKAVIKKADDESRAMSKEEEETWNTMDADFQQIDKEVERRQKVEERESALAQPLTPAPKAQRAAAPEPVSSDEQRERYTRAFWQWARRGTDGLSPEQRNIMFGTQRRTDLSDVPVELRAQTVGTGSEGGFLVPEGFSGELEKQLKSFGGMRSVARVYPTPGGNDIPWPTVNDTSNVGELVAESASYGEQDAAFNEVTLKAYKYTSKFVKVSQELLQDSFFPIDQVLQDLLMERIARINNTHFTTGDGSGKPQGAVAGSTLGKTGASATAVTALELFDLEHSLDPAYRPNARFMLNDATLKAIRKLLDNTGGSGQGNFLWQPGLAAGAPNTILGYPYVVNQDMADMASSAKSILFGDFSKYIIRDVRPMSLARLNELHALTGHVSFVAISRADGRILQSAAIKHFINAA